MIIMNHLQYSPFESILHSRVNMKAFSYEVRFCIYIYFKILKFFLFHVLEHGTVYLCKKYMLNVHKKIIPFICRCCLNT